MGIVRRFNGKQYYYDSLHARKRDARLRAERLRAQGNLARVVPVKRGAEVWDRPGVKQVSNRK